MSIDTFDKIMTYAEANHDQALAALQEALEKLPEKALKDILSYLEEEEI